MRRRGHRVALAATVAALAAACGAAPALGDFPYGQPGPANDYTRLFLTPDDPKPSDLAGDDNDWKFASTVDPGNSPLLNANPVELGGIRGAHLADADRHVAQGINLTTGRPDVTIAVLDSGIKWNDGGAMSDLRRKVRLNRGELPLPQNGANVCAAYDCNGDGVFNVDDYANDPRVNLSDSRRVGPAGVLVPQDLIIAFSDGSDGDGNGFVDDIAGWDFLDNDNDPFDDVQYGHGTGEAKDSSSEANNDGQLGSCPNCMVLPLRVGDSFVADVNHFAQATLYATDNNVQVVQEALGTLNNSSLARAAVNYAYRHGTTVIASAADEAAQHNNWPSSLPHVILVNSVTESLIPSDPSAPISNKSYLALNGCTNFNAKITLAIPSDSCSSNATGLASGMAGLIYSAAYTAVQKGFLSPFPDGSLCSLIRDNPITTDTGCLITPNEVRQLMASGRIDPDPNATLDEGYQADDVNFAGTPPTLGPEPSCSPAPAPGCTDPNGALQAQVNVNRGPSLLPLPPGAFQSYPARKGDDQFYGYGRVNMAKALGAILDKPVPTVQAKIPPDVEITSPEWFQMVDPALASLTVTGQVFARGRPYSCDIYVAPGHYPNNGLTTDTPPGDFQKVSNGACDGSTRSAPLDGSLGSVDLGALKSRFPPETQATGFSGREPGGGAQTSNGRPNTDPYGFVVKVVATLKTGSPTTGEDQRAVYLHRDQDMLDGFPKGIRREAISTGTPTGDGESSPVLADLDGDNRNELIVAGSDGFVHAIRRNGSELPGWPVRGDRPPLHLGEQAFQSGEVSSDVGGAILGSVAVADVNHDGVPEVFADDLEGKVYGWRADGSRFFGEEANPAFSGKPLQPFVNSRHGEFNRTEHGFIGSPVVADLDGSGGMEVIAAGMDRHVYAWHPNGSLVQGFPVLVVDSTKVQSVDPQTHQVTFKPDSGSKMQGAIVDTPAVADLNGDGKAEIVVGTNEEYEVASDGGFNGSQESQGSLLDQATAGVEAFKDGCDAQGGHDVCKNIPGLIGPANSRLYAIHPDGNGHQGGPFLAGWPVKIGVLNNELLPVVGEGVTGYPVIAKASCGGPSPEGGSGPKIGAMANNGEAYVFAANGKSCFGQDGSNHDRPLQTDGYPNQGDHPLVPAVGHPAFADLGGGMTLVAPAAGLGRALDVVAPEYQRTGQDFIAAWSLQAGGTLLPNYPQTMNDLQFLTGPSIADIDGLPGQEIVEGSASKDLQAYTVAGTPAGPRWPKLTGDWTVANPTIGSFGTLDTAASARKVVIGLTRSGYLNAYATDAPACSAGDWPRFHHDNANSGDYDRDATLPGTPSELSLSNGRLGFTSPGDDLMCGKPRAYQIRTSAQPITAANFDDAVTLGGAPAAVVAGGRRTYDLPSSAKRFVAVRAVDDQGNVGRPASVDRNNPPSEGEGGGGGGGGAGGGGGGNPNRGPCANRIAGTRGPDRLRGTSAGDRLIGGRGPDRLFGFKGADCLRGNGGPDVLRGGKGRDKLLGGIDQDRLFARDGVRDLVRCGKGRHDVAVVDRRDRVAGCETVRKPKRKRR